MHATIGFCTILTDTGLIPPISLALFLMIVSWLDDRRSLPIVVRLIVHIACAIVVIPVYLIPNTDWSTYLLGILSIAWLTNLFNFMDGIDGMTGGAAFIGFGIMGIAFFLGLHDTYATTSLIIAMASLGFLFFNSQPAKIFMGDAGSIPLGFLAGCLGILGWQRHSWPIWFPLLVFSPLIIDASLTLLRRIVGREYFWRAHRDHAYQRMIRMGWSHRKVATAYHALMLVAGISGLLTLFWLEASVMLGWVVTGAWLLLLSLIYWGVNRRWAGFTRQGG